MIVSSDFSEVRIVKFSAHEVPLSSIFQVEPDLIQYSTVPVYPMILQFCLTGSGTAFVAANAIMRHADMRPEKQRIEAQP
jgi:hypothetical protein